MVKLMKKFVMAREQTQVSVKQALVESYHKFMATILWYSCLYGGLEISLVSILWHVQGLSDGLYTNKRRNTISNAPCSWYCHQLPDVSYPDRTSMIKILTLRFSWFPRYRSLNYVNLPISYGSKIPPRFELMAYLTLRSKQFFVWKIQNRKLQILKN